jgi:hypothetical protein
MKCCEEQLKPWMKITTGADGEGGSEAWAKILVPSALVAKRDFSAISI